jgi:hypothetical protein
MPEDARLTLFAVLLSENVASQAMTPDEMVTAVYEDARRYWQLQLSEPMTPRQLARNLSYHMADSAEKLDFCIDGILSALQHAMTDHVLKFPVLPGAGTNHWTDDPIINLADAVGWLAANYPTLVRGSLRAYLA